MNAIGFATLALTIALPVAWLISEFRASRGVRIAVGLAAIAMSYGVASFVGGLQMLNANAWYGSVTKQLVEQTIASLRAEHHERVLSAFEQLNDGFSPGYDTRSQYDELVLNAVAGMKADSRE